MITLAQILKKNDESSNQIALFQWAAIAANGGFEASDYWAETGVIKFDGEPVPKLKWMHHVPNGGQRNISVAAKLKAEGVRKGIPDISLPVASGKYHGLYIEMKSPQKIKLGLKACTKEQLEFRIHAINEGYMWAVCFSWREAANLIKEYLS